MAAARTTTKPTTIEQTPEPPPENLPAPRPRSTGVSAILPTTWQEVTAIAGAICRASMAPKSYCKVDGYGKLVYVDGKPVPEPDKVAIAIMHGMEVGFSPMAALQSIAVINGMPSVYGDGLLALIRASDLLEDIEETTEWAKDGPVSATCKMWRKGEKTPSTQTYTRADAVKAKLWAKPGPWTDHPARMLQWRARGWCGRDKFADVLRGLRIAEEVEDMVDITPHGSATTAPAEPRREDFKPSPAEMEKPQAESGQRSTDSPAPGVADRKADPPAEPEGDATPAHDPETGEIPEGNVTDVVDQNDKGDLEDEAPEAPPLFEDFGIRVGAFFNFADTWLQDPIRMEAEVVAFGAFYNKFMQDRMKPDYKNRAAMLDTYDLYQAALKRSAKR